MRKLKEILEDLEKEFNDIRFKNPLKKRRTNKQACTALLVNKYGEVLLILRRILNEQQVLLNLHNKLFPPDQSISEQQHLEYINKHFQFTRCLELDIKSFYEWVYHIQEILEDCKINIDLGNLKRISFLRGKFITHISNQEFFKKSVTTHGGIRFDKDFENIEILFFPLIFPKKKQFIGLSSLRKELIPYIPELSSENNAIQSIILMYHNLNRITDSNLKEEVKKFIKNNGLATESPALIAETLLQTLKEYRKITKT